ncbi:hypothetical protein G9F32_12520 [Acinetobacter sp. 194]|uniref:hypothetical protein n=1 Tax=Acinetobacter shaoyimingii TaxID=2715164 RepID=UPI001408D38E|nr:hypothetical protein [Acinetobacter shaoyimingii]NHB58833.1 hypothetical protein [Acinetobacter shaoyimingii]
MSDKNSINQTHLIISAITASLIKALDKQSPGLKVEFLSELKEQYYEIREKELVHNEALETLIWTKELIEKN